MKQYETIEIVKWIFLGKGDDERTKSYIYVCININIYILAIEKKIFIYRVKGDESSRTIEFSKFSIPDIVCLCTRNIISYIYI